ncbi:MAG TPA: histidine phosphatase family protein [Thermodesulfobacteriota bacterium]|nr:histidine phosphatase family protein [Thermodesulfobacteriota bacterium]
MPEKKNKNECKMRGTRIFLVRHGETHWNLTHRFQGRKDVPLNQEGKDQARALALTLKDAPLTAIYSSPLVRAIETARVIKEFHPSTPLFEEEGLIEMDLGEFDGMEAAYWFAHYQDFIKAWRSAPGCLKMPGGESLQEVQTRAIDTLRRITKLYPSGNTLLICSHNFVNCALLCQALGFPLDRFRDVHQDTATLNILYMRGQRLWAELVNDISHLKKYKGILTQA